MWLFAVINNSLILLWNFHVCFQNNINRLNISILSNATHHLQTPLFLSSIIDNKNWENKRYLKAFTII